MAQPILPFFVVVSLLWAFWDPTYAAFRQAQLQGRDVRVVGKRVYIVSLIVGEFMRQLTKGRQLLQMTTWCIRLMTSIILSIRYLRPHLDVLGLSFPSSTRARNYFLSVLILETAVCVALVACLVD